MNEELCQFIEDAFSDAPKPAFGTLSVPTYDDEGTNAYFGRTDWRDHDIRALRAHESSLTVFTPPALRYYLPAFLIESIRHPAQADVIPGNVVSELLRDERLAAFTLREREALARFVEWWRDRICPASPLDARPPHQHVQLSALANRLRTSNQVKPASLRVTATRK